jgi:hypothetical protein
MNNYLTHTTLQQLSYPTEQSHDTHSLPVVQLPKINNSLNRQLYFSSVTQLNNPLIKRALLHFSYPTEKSPNTDSPPAVQLKK